MPFKNLLSKLTPPEEGGKNTKPYTVKNRPETPHKQDMHFRTNYPKEASSEAARIARQAKLRDLNIQRNMKKAELDQVLHRLHLTKPPGQTHKERKDLDQAHNRLNAELHALTQRIHKVIQIDQEINAQYPPRRRPRDEIERQFDPPRQPRYQITDPASVHHHLAPSANQPWHNPIPSQDPISRPNPGYRPRQQQQQRHHLIPSPLPPRSSSSTSKHPPTRGAHPASVSPDISPLESHFAFQSEDGDYCVSPIEQRRSPSWGRRW